jgi:hypothetical protein
MGTPSPAAIADLAACMRGQVVAPGDPNYPGVRGLWNARITTRPALIALCQDAEDVATGLAFARAEGLRVVVRGGGHHVGGSASIDGGLVLDLSAMRSVVVDASARTCTVGGGATWRDVDLATQAFGLAVPGGTVSTTGVGGLTLGGGLGWLRRRFGLTCDHLTAATLVTASGHVRRANESTEADLIWALRGGGGNFGVVTEFVFRLHELGPLVAHAEVYYEPTEAKSALLALCRHMRDAEEHVAPLAILGRPPQHAPIETDAGGGPTLTVLAVYAGEADVGMQALQPLRTLAAPACDLSGVSPYTSVQSAFDAEFPAGDRYASRSLVVEDLSEDVVDVLIGVASPPVRRGPPSPSGSREARWAVCPQTRARTRGARRPFSSTSRRAGPIQPRTPSTSVGCARRSRRWVATRTAAATRTSLATANPTPRCDGSTRRPSLACGRSNVTSIRTTCSARCPTCGHLSVAVSGCRGGRGERRDCLRRSDRADFRPCAIPVVTRLSGRGLSNEGERRPRSFS